MIAPSWHFGPYELRKGMATSGGQIPVSRAILVGAGVQSQTLKVPGLHAADQFYGLQSAAATN